MLTFALYHAFSVCQCRWPGFPPPGKITICNHFSLLSDKPEKAGNRPADSDKKGKKGGRKRGELLLSLVEILLRFRGVCLDLREKLGLRNHFAKGAIQQVIHIIHILVHKGKARYRAIVRKNRGKNEAIRGKIKGSAKNAA